MRVNCYPLIFKIKVVNYYHSKECNIMDILRIFGISKSSLYNWILLYKNNNLSDKPRYNKYSKYTDEVEKYICNYVLKRINFNCDKILKMIKKRFNISGSKSSIYSILKKNNITRKRINVKTKICSDRNIKRKIKDLSDKIGLIKKENIISIDESSFDSHINSHYGWNIKGEQLIVNKRKQRKRFSIISAISINKIIGVNITKGSVNSNIFTEFIKNISKKINNKKVLFMDNAVIHHSKIFTEYIKTNNKKILYNIPYCSELNPIEMVFSKVKNIVRCKNGNESEIKLIKNIKYAFNKITKENLKSYYDKSLTF